MRLKIYDTLDKLEKRIELLEDIIDRVEELKKEYWNIKEIAKHYGFEYTYFTRVLNGEHGKIEKLEYIYNLIK